MTDLATKLAALRAQAQGLVTAPPPPAPTAPPPTAPTAPTQGPPAPSDLTAKLAKLRAAVTGGPTTSAAPPPDATIPGVMIKTPADVTSKLAALRAAVAGTATPPPPSSTATPPPPPSTEPATSARYTLSAARVRFLFLNCAPIAGLVAVNVETLCEPIEAQIFRETGISWKVLDYGKGDGFLGDGLRALATLPEAIIIDTTTRLGKAAKDALVARADVVVIGGAS